MGCDCRHSFVSVFLRHFFDIGCNCGSIISETFELIKTFQKISATISFRTRFSPECAEMFSWATDIADLFVSFIDTNPLNDFEVYSIYTLILPVIIMSFLFRMSMKGYYFIFAIIPVGLCLMLGTGIGFFTVNNILAITLTSISGSILIIGMIFFSCCNEVNLFCILGDLLTNSGDFHYLQSMTVDKFFYSLKIPIFLAYVLVIPIMMNREILITQYSVIIGVIAFVETVVSFGFRCYEWLDEKVIGERIVELSISIIQLLIIPSTRSFIELMQGVYKNEWRCIVSYVVLSLIYPFIIAFINVYSGNLDASQRYKEETWRQYIALVDTIKQILYAIFAGYDIVWACLFIDLAWAIFILITRPYRRWSDYFLECGNCFITVAANSLVLYSIYQDSKMLSIDVAIPLIAVAFVPAIVSLYVFFSHDFGRYEGYTEDDFFEIISGFSLVLAPVAWIIYGLNLPLIDKKVFKPEI